MENNLKKTGLVLGGGGSKGCYEIGAWEALDQCKISFDVVSGTSIGALVGAIYTQQTLDAIVDFAENMSPQKIAVDFFTLPDNVSSLIDHRDQFFDFIRKYAKTGMDIAPLKNALEKMFDYEKFKNSPINYACQTFNVTKFEGQAFFKDQMTPENSIDIILASASCYPAFPMLEMDGDFYIDGGFANNVPIDLAMDMGAEKMTVIDVHGPGRTKAIPEGQDILYIQPLLPLGNFLDFSKANCERCVSIGYLETMKYLNQFCGYLYTFTKESWPRIYMLEQFLQMHLAKKGVHLNMNSVAHDLEYACAYKPYPLHNQYQSDYVLGTEMEALAYMAGVEAVKLYSYSDFLNETYKTLTEQAERLKNITISMENINDFAKSNKRMEIVTLVYLHLKAKKGRLSLLLEPVRTLFSANYHLALTWFFLDQYLRKGQKNPGDLQ